MDIEVIDLPKSWGMLLSRKFGADLEGSLQMDLSYATIPTPEGDYINLQRETMRKHHVEDLAELKNEYIYQHDIGSYAVLATDISSSEGHR